MKKSAALMEPKWLKGEIMEDFERTEMEMETSYPETEEAEETAAYDYPETEAQTSDNASAAFIAGVFAAGTAVGIGVSKLAGKVKEKIAVKRGEKPAPVKRKTKLKFQLPWRREEVIEVPITEPAKPNPEPNQEQEG